MIPHTFTYERAVSPEHALGLLQEDVNAQLLAGGHSLIPLMKMRLVTPSKLIDISGLPELRGIKLEGHHIVVGALSTHREVATNPLINTYLPALAEAAVQVTDIRAKNRGTMGGNLAHADPTSDLPAITLAYDAALTVLGSEGAETLFCEDFFLGPMQTALPRGNVILSVSFGIPPAGAKSTYVKYPHPSAGYASIGVAAVVGTDGNQLVNYARISITGAANIAYRARTVEHALIGKPLTEEFVHYAASFAADDGEIPGNPFASEAYRKHLCTVYTARALKRLV